MAAAFFAAPEWELQENEAKALAKSIAEVQKHYSIPGMSEEHAALIALAVTVGSVYIPRVIITTSRKKMGNRQAQPQAAPTEAVSPFAANMMPDFLTPSNSRPDNTAVN